MSFNHQNQLSEDDYDFDVDEVTSSESNAPIVFERLRSTTAKCIGLFVFCVASIGFGLLMFLLHAFVIPGNNQFAMHASSTLPILMGIFAGSAAWSLMSTPVRVRVGTEGIEVEKVPPRMIPWEQIGSVYVDTHNNGWGGPPKSLRLMGSDGKVIIRIGGAIEDFDRLIELAREGSSQATPEVTLAEMHGPDKTALSQGRRRAMITGFGAILIGSATVFLTYDGWWTLQAEKRMASEGVPGTGTVLRHFIAPNGITRRIEYQVQADNGSSATHNVEVNKDLHDNLRVADTVQIRYVPGDPRISQLTSGEILDADDPLKSPLGMILLGCGAAVMSIFMAVMTVVSWKGYDIKVDGGKMRMVPLGR